MATELTESPAMLHRLSIADYQRMGQVGILGEDDRVELVEGVLVDMMSIGLDHGRATLWLTRWFTPHLPDELAAWSQTDVVLPELISQLQPDLAVVRFAELAHRLPETPELVIEVADSSLRYDRKTKARLYARHGVVEYWIVNLVDARVEVHREPRREGYAEHRHVGPDDELRALVLPEQPLDVAALLRFALRGER